MIPKGATGVFQQGETLYIPEGWATGPNGWQDYASSNQYDRITSGDMGYEFYNPQPMEQAPAEAVPGVGPQAIPAQEYTNLGEENGVVNPGIHGIGTNPFESPLYNGIANILNKQVTPNNYYGFNFQNKFAHPLYQGSNPFGNY